MLPNSPLTTRTPTQTNRLEQFESRSALDDPVPGCAESSFFGQQCDEPHSVESEIRRLLMSLDDVEFSSLEVRRIPNGVCLSGTVHTHDEEDLIRLESLARVQGINQVLNRLVVHVEADAEEV